MILTTEDKNLGPRVSARVKTGLTSGCAISGGPFKKSYHTVMGIDQIIPVDVYVPGCPPSPNAIIYGMLQLSRKIKVQEFFSLPKQPKVVEHLDNPIEVVKYV